MSPIFSRSPLTLLALLLALPPLAASSSSFPLPTIAIAAAGTNTASPHHLACGLVSNGTGYQLSCASVTNRSASPRKYGYGGGSTTPFSALVAGDGYLCSVDPISSPPVSMRWWDLNDGEEPSKRVYRGEALSAVAGGGEYVCGLVEKRIKCWRWEWGAVPEEVGFSALAVGGGFVCGLVAGTGELKCYGNGDAVGREPRGRDMLLAAGERHACAVDHRGMLGCWGEAAAVAAEAPPKLIRAVSTVAVGDALTCVLWGNWTVSCWPEEDAAVPPEISQEQFVALEARGKVVCGVLMSDYSLFMHNGTLHDHLHKRPAPLSPPLASWPSRLRLALGAARGIEYLHTYAVPPIIHRDIKSSNILLDASWSAKVSDFGLSLLKNLGTGDNAGGEEPCVTAGTVGYMDPEYYRLQHLTDKSDVYSFGVLLLELLSGCKVIQRYEGSGTPRNVVDMAVPYIESDRVHRVLDIRLPLPTPGEMEAVAYVGYLAADCVRLPGRERPSMSEVVGVLERAVAACEEHEDSPDGGEAALSRSCTDGSTTM
uniref:Serine/threonine-protein kinase-like protein CCR4 n=1 Tax=Aegilops tauschii TaxID=37682 RepID=N1QUG6_AEGTA